MTIKPDAVVLTAPDGCTTYLKMAVEQSLRYMGPDAILEVPCDDPATRGELAEWCLSTGHRIVDPFEHLNVDRLLLANTSSRVAVAD